MVIGLTKIGFVCSMRRRTQDGGGGCIRTIFFAEGGEGAVNFGRKNL